MLKPNNPKVNSKLTKKKTINYYVILMMENPTIMKKKNPKKSSDAIDVEARVTSQGIAQNRLKK